MNEFEFLSIINPFKDKLFRIAKRMLISIEEAEDATQEVFYKLLKTDLKALKNVEAMAVIMTKNYCLDQLKSKRSGNLKLVHTNYSDSSSLEKQIVDKDSLSKVEMIINSLPEQQRLIVQLREIEEYDFSEIANILDMNETAIRVSLSRARKIIKENILKLIIMEINKIESLLEKYFEGNTSISEEKQLKNYFLSDNVASHLIQHKELFVFYSDSKNEQLSKEIKLPIKRKNTLKWMSIAASFVVISSVATFVYLQLDNPKQEDLGTFDNPEEAFIETHKALQLVATNINSGMKNVSYLEEYENTKKLIFK